MAEATSDEIELTEALVLRPGDELIVRVNIGADVEQVTELAQALRKRFPRNEVTVLAADQLAVARA